MPDREQVLQGLKCSQYSSKSHCDGCPYAYDAYDGLTGILDCTADLACDALELLKEQEPVKPEVYWVANEYKFYRCPACKIGWHYKYDYCPKCGRAVKWDA